MDSSPSPTRSLGGLLPLGVGGVALTIAASAFLLAPPDAGTASTTSAPPAATSPTGEAPAELRSGPSDAAGTLFTTAPQSLATRSDPAASTPVAMIREESEPRGADDTRVPSADLLLAAPAPGPGQPVASTPSGHTPPFPTPPTAETDSSTVAPSPPALRGAALPHRHVTLAGPGSADRFRDDASTAPASGTTTDATASTATTEGSAIGPDPAASVPGSEASPRPEQDSEPEPEPAFETEPEPASEDDAGSAPEAEPTAPWPPTDTLNRVIGWFNIGWSTSDPRNRNIGWGLSRGGWPGFIRTLVTPQIEGGVRRFMLHNPFGTLAGEKMQLDQFLHAQQAGLTFITDGFVEQWKPVTDAGIEVIGYVGSGRVDPDFNALEDDPEAWQTRAMASVQPMLNAGMSIALDAAAPAPAGSPTHVFAERLRAMGVRVYVEAKPKRDAPHWFDYGVIAINSTWLRSDIDTGHVNWREHFGTPDGTITGDVVRLLRGSDLRDAGRGDREGARQAIEEVQADGHTACLILNRLVSGNHPLAELLGSADARADVSFD